MKTVKTALALLLSISTIFAQDNTPKTLPELIEYAKKNLSDFSITSYRDRYIIYRHITSDLEWLSRSDSKEIHFAMKSAKDVIEETKMRLIGHRSALLQEKSAAQQEVNSESVCSYQDYCDAQKLFKHIVWGYAVKDNFAPNQKCLNPILITMQTTVNLATIANDLKVCDTITTALDQIKL